MAFDPLMGDPRLYDRFATHEAKGNLLAARARYVREEYGQDALDALARRVPEPARTWLVKPPLPFAWYSFDLLLAIDREMIAGPMGGDLGEIKRFGNAIARYDLSTLYQVMLKLGRPSFVLKRIGLVYAQYLRPGQASGDVQSAGGAAVTVEEAWFPYYFCDQGIPGWLQAAVELSGGEAVRVSQAECVHHGADACKFDIAWE